LRENEIQELLLLQMLQWRQQAGTLRLLAGPHIGLVIELRPTLPPLRPLSSSPARCRTGPKKVGGGTIRENMRKKYRNLVVKEEDLNKRPSDLEISQKGLPDNTPTLGERMDRDVYRTFHQADEKHGYHNLRPQVG
jgi:hypothetical protein